jgi:hypothetical protein
MTLEERLRCNLRSAGSSASIWMCGVGGHLFTKNGPRVGRRGGYCILRAVCPSQGQRFLPDEHDGKLIEAWVDQKVSRGRQSPCRVAIGSSDKFLASLPSHVPDQCQACLDDRLGGPVVQEGSGLEGQPVVLGHGLVENRHGLGWQCHGHSGDRNRERDEALTWVVLDGSGHKRSKLSGNRLPLLPCAIWRCLPLGRDRQATFVRQFRR